MIVMGRHGSLFRIVVFWRSRDLEQILGNVSTPGTTGCAGAMAGTRLIQDKYYYKTVNFVGYGQAGIPFVNGMDAEVNLIDDYRSGILEQASFIVGSGL